MNPATNAPLQTLNESLLRDMIPQINNNISNPSTAWQLENILRNILMSHVILREPLRPSHHALQPRITNETLIRVHLIPYSSEDDLPQGLLERCRSSRSRKRHRDYHVSHLPSYQKINNDMLHDLDSCSVCYQSYQTGEYIRELPLCKHSFHKKCVDKWLRADRERMSCPLCRTSHLPEEIVKNNEETNRLSQVDPIGA